MKQKYCKKIKVCPTQIRKIKHSRFKARPTSETAKFQASQAHRLNQTYVAADGKQYTHFPDQVVTLHLHLHC
jgi:hypothetical protein